VGHPASAFDAIASIVEQSFQQPAAQVSLRFRWQQRRSLTYPLKMTQA
jgi:hypothetical protein